MTHWWPVWLASAVFLIVGFIAMRRVIRDITLARYRGPLDGSSTTEFVDTPEAWKARQVRPGETREQARKRLEQYRK